MHGNNAAQAVIQTCVCRRNTAYGDTSGNPPPPLAEHRNFLDEALSHIAHLRSPRLLYGKLRGTANKGCT